MNTAKALILQYRADEAATIAAETAREARETVQREARELEAAHQISLWLARRYEINIDPVHIKASEHSVTGYFHFRIDVNEYDNVAPSDGAQLVEKLDQAEIAWVARRQGYPPKNCGFNLLQALSYAAPIDLDEWSL
jgi:hypothetical protein